MITITYHSTILLYLQKIIKIFFPNIWKKNTYNEIKLATKNKFTIMCKKIRKNGKYLFAKHKIYFLEFGEKIIFWRIFFYRVYRSGLLGIFKHANILLDGSTSALIIHWSFLRTSKFDTRSTYANKLSTMAVSFSM